MAAAVAAEAAAGVSAAAAAGEGVNAAAASDSCDESPLEVLLCNRVRGS